MRVKPVRSKPKRFIQAADAARLGRALAFAADHHGAQTRKGTSIPYVSHLLHVAGLVMEQGGSLDQAIAGLLHDVVEDCDDVGYDDISGHFGTKVARLVKACTDTLEGDTPKTKSPWKERKRIYLAHLANAPKSAVLVSACDKRHNLGSLVDDVKRQGLSYMKRFNSTPKDQVWFYRQFREAIKGRVPKALDDELRELIDEFARLVEG